MILYADVYIIINFFCDWTALWCCAKINSSRISYIHIGLASCFMSFAALFCVLCGINGVFYTVCTAFVMTVGCLIAYGRMAYARFLKTVLVFFVCNVVTGGVVGWVSQMSLSGFIAAVFLTPLIYMLWSNIAKSSLNKISVTTASVDIDGIRLEGIADSGNFVTEPSSGLPVIFVNRSAVCNVLPEKFFLIEITTASGIGVLPCYRPDTVKINKSSVSAMVALDENDTLKYDCIVPMSLV